MSPVTSESVADLSTGLSASRRGFVRSALAVAAGVAAVPLAAIAAEAADEGPGPYGPLQGPDANGVRLPVGFTARVIARSSQNVPGTNFSFRGAPDGAATFDDGSGGWYYTINHELPSGGGGVSCLRFDPTGNVIDAYSILSGTTRNCAGGVTPWGTWLSCEENGSSGQIWECDPTQPGQGIVRPAMGSRNHEAVAVDPVNQQLFITEDAGSGKLWRFTPTSYPNLTSGVLERAVWNSSTGQVSWSTSGGSGFSGGEGIWYHDGRVYFTTKGDHRVWELDVTTTPNTLEIIWDGNPSDSSRDQLTAPDNLTVSADSGDLFVAEDGGNMEIVMITPDGVVAPFLRVDHGGSEITGPVFNPAGDRLYFSSQRGNNAGSSGGITFEVTGPFRSAVAPPTATAVPATPTPTPVSGVVTLQNRQLGSFLSEAVAQTVTLRPAADVTSQWQIVNLANGNAHIVNLSTGRYLQGNGHRGLVDTAATPSADDQWQLTQLASGVTVLKNVSANSNLDGDRDGRARLRRGTKDDKQWTLSPVGGAPVTPVPGTATPIPPPPPPPPSPQPTGDVFTLQSLRYGTYLSEPAPQTIALAATPSGSSWWQVVPLANGNAHIINVATGNWLDGDGRRQLVDTSLAPGADDEWKMSQLSSGNWLLENTAARQNLDADADGLVRLRKGTGDDRQWILTPVQPIAAAGLMQPGDSFRLAAERLAEPTATSLGTGSAIVLGGAAAALAWRDRRRNIAAE